MLQTLAGALVGLITSGSNQAPLPYADVSAREHAYAALADARGEFRFSSVPAGTITLRVRRIGFQPKTIQLTVEPGRTDTIRITLVPVPLQLERVKSSDEACPGRQPRAADSVIVTILEQIRINAERYALVAHEYPFEITMERTFADELPDGVRLRRRVRRVDTIAVGGESGRRYEPGRLVDRTPDPAIESHGRLFIPRLRDFADSLFLAVHCFRYAGMQTRDERRVARVDFEPVRSLRHRDVSGSLFLDPVTYQIERTRLALEIPSLAAPMDIWTVALETWFHEVLPGTMVIDRVCQRTLTRRNTGSAVPGAATESQRLLDLVFLENKPGEPDLATAKARTAMECS